LLGLAAASQCAGAEPVRKRGDRGASAGCTLAQAALHPILKVPDNPIPAPAGGGAHHSSTRTSAAKPADAWVFQ
jgi:hypothetical protein